MSTKPSDRCEQPEEILAEILDALLHEDSITKATVESVRANIEGYEHVTEASLEQSARRNITLAINAIRDGQVSITDTMMEAQRLGQERHHQGVPMATVLAGFRVSISTIYRSLLNRSLDSGLPLTQALETTTILWELGDVFSAKVMAAYQAEEVERAVTESARKDEWIRSLFRDSTTYDERLKGAFEYGIPSDRTVRALISNAHFGSADQVQQRLREWARNANVHAVTAVHGKQIVGILVSDLTPSVHPDETTIAIGHPAKLERITDSHKSASKTLEAAETFGITGIVHRERLTWLMGVHACPDITELLIKRYLEPVEAAGTFAPQIIEALTAYLNNQRNMTRAAKSIPVHSNTLRYRLTKFIGLTGADLADTNTLIEISWALSGRKFND